ncbi:hypothetical protein Tco_1236517 [Tanacetum coccineum]
MDEDFYATAYPSVHDNLKLRTDEHVTLESPPSTTEPLLSLKNLDDTYNFGDQFINDKPTKDDQNKSNVEAETVFIIPDPSHQTDTSAPPVSTPVINISSPKPSSPPVHAPLITASTGITSTILALPPPLPTQSSSNSDLAARVADLEKRNVNLEHAFTTQNKTINNISFKIFKLEHRDLEYRIDNYVRDAVKDSVEVALRALLL